MKRNDILKIAASLVLLLGATSMATQIAVAQEGGNTQPAYNQTASRVTWYTDLSAAINDAKAQGKLVLIDAGASWCPWCQRMDEVTYADPSVQQFLSQFVCVRLNTDDGAGAQFAQEHNINGIPATVVLDPVTGRLADNQGFVQPAQFAAMVQQLEQQIA